MKNRLSIFIISLLCMVMLVACASDSSSVTTESSSEAAGTTASAQNETIADASGMRIGALKGPTTMGIANLLSEKYLGDVSFTMSAAADEVVAAVVKGEVDIALVPANVAAILYQKTEHKISVIDINTLGVLYIVDKSGDIKSIKDLEGKKLYMTGKGTTPDYVLQYLLKNNGVDINAVDINFCSEAAEVITSMAADEKAVGLLPQPFVTTAMMKDDSLKIALDLTEEWEKVNSNSKLLTGVTIVRNEYLENNPDMVKAFIAAHKKSVDAAAADLDKTAGYIEELRIVGAGVVKKAFDKCHIVCITGAEMQKDLSGYIQTLLDMDPATVGGTLPDNGFYYINE